MPTLTPEQVEEAARVMPDHTLATSFMAPEARARVIALILFAHELSRARAVVSEAGLAAIRLQWWRDVIDQIYTGQVVRAQPTAIALKSAIDEAKLPRALFDAMVDGYEAELIDAPFASWEDLDAYLDATAGNLIRLSLLASGLTALSTSASQLARYAGIAWGLASLLRATPAWFARRRLWLPQQECADLAREALFAGSVSPDLRAMFIKVQVRIKAARQAANRSIKHASLGDSLPAIAPACLSGRIAVTAIPDIGEVWRVGAEPSLLERQVRITVAVALGRI
jgi:15-cis-phytoene synthase